MIVQKLDELEEVAFSHQFESSKVAVLQEEMATQTDEHVNPLTAEVDQLTLEVQTLKGELYSMQAENSELKKQLTKERKERKALTPQIASASKIHDFV
mmetsp:Transcript_29156/g.43927  ORF Transcript_29156/g.43927 Transcript_29156/m.43927 type:complete len:98 (+) Transcript_29156:2710-3003(+)